MKTVCVAIIVLSLISVSQSASLECKKLVKPVDQEQNVLGRWYLIGMSSTFCWAQVLFNTLFVPSFLMDITSTERLNYYNISLTVKLSEFCENETVQVFYAVNSIFEIDGQNNLKMEGKAMLLHSGCQDCLVVSGDGATEVIALLSRRPVITADEMKEFEAQAQCIGLYKPQIFGSDHDLGNCGDSDIESTDLGLVVRQRLKNMFSELLICTTDTVLYYPRAAYKWVQQTWAGLW